MNDNVKLLNDLTLIAEPSFQEFKTTRYIIDFLKNHSIKIEKELKTGCFGTINVNAKKTIAIRADIDALPFDDHHTIFKHLCGHHAHTAGLLLALANINKNKKKLKTNIRYIFQPAEETGIGAKFVIKHGALENVSEVYGLHGEPNYALGKICLKNGRLMAGSGSFDLTIKGKGTHAAFPQYGNDVIVAIADYINLCQKIISRFKNPVESGIISFTMIKGGFAKNILPEKVEAAGTFRFFDKSVKKLIKQKMLDILGSIEKIYNVTGKINFNLTTEPVINNKKSTEKLKNILKKEFDIVEDYTEVMGSEDFSEYLKEIPGVYFIVGIAKNANHPPLHNKNFFVPDEAVMIYKKIWETIAFNYE
jgi:amidohydrolase